MVMEAWPASGQRVKKVSEFCDHLMVQPVLCNNISLFNTGLIGISGSECNRETTDTDMSCCKGMLFDRIKSGMPYLIHVRNIMSFYFDKYDFEACCKINRESRSM